MLQRKRTQPFAAPKDKRTKDIIKKNSVASPLLRLPKELREKIWCFLLGHRTLHIKYAATHRWEPDNCAPSGAELVTGFNGTFTYIVCEATVSGRSLTTSEHHDAIATREQGDHDNCLSRYRHATCYACYDDCLDVQYHPYDRYVGCPKDRRRLANNRLPLAILRTCRQAYVEVNPVLWGTTLWSFTHALAFSKFMHNRNAGQRRLLKMLHLDLDTRYCWVPETWAAWWKQAIRRSLLKQFGAVEVLHLDIAGNQYPRQTYMDLGYVSRQFSNIDFDEWLELRVLPLKKVFVTCMKTANQDGSSMTYLERQKMAEAIQAKLIDAAGEALHESEKRKLKRKSSLIDAAQRKNMYSRHYGN